MVTRNRTIKALAAVGVMTLALTGCAGSESPGAAEDPAEVTGTLRVLIPSFPASNEGTAAFDAVVEAFHEEYPGVEVDADFATFGNLNEKISTSLAGGQPYDVLVTGIGWVPPFASKGAFLDLEQFDVNADSIAEETTSAMLPAVTYEDAIYAYPLIIGAKPLALSRSAFVAAGLDPDSPPTSLAEVADIAETLTERDASGAITRVGFDFWAAASNYRHSFVSVLGALGKHLYEDGKPGFDGGEGVEAIDWMDEMINDRETIAFGQTSASGAPLMFTGEAAMGFTGSYVDCEAVTQELCDDLVFFNLEEDETAMFSGGQVASIGAGTDLPEAAWGLIQALSTPEAEAAMSVLNFAVPAASGSGDTEVVQSNPASQFVYENLDQVVFEGGAANWLDLRDSFNTELDKALLGQSSAQEVLDYLTEQSE